MDRVKEATDCGLEIVRRRKGERGFTVLPRRWVVDRTLTWLGKHRRMSKDCERLAETLEAWIRLMLRRRDMNRIIKHTLSP